MTPTAKLKPGMKRPNLRWHAVGGGEVTTGDIGHWQLIVVYRGQHCPLCKQYLSSLNALVDEFATLGIHVAALSSDPAERAETDVTKFNWRFPVAYGLSQQEMRRLGLYISEPRSPKETDRPFAEPGLFVVNPNGELHIIDTSNAPFARPDLKTLLQGLKYVKESGYPVRGTMA